MKKIMAIVTTSLIISCVGMNKKKKGFPPYTFGGFSEKSEISNTKIDGHRAYKRDFKLLGNAKCIEISLTTVEIRKKFPVGRTEVPNFFAVQKFFTRSKDDTMQYLTPLGKNYNKQWKSSSSLKLCSDGSKPLSNLKKGKYRIIFTTAGENSFYYEVKIKSPVPISFQD